VASTVDFRASAASSAPLAYQWFFNTTTALSGGTNLVLRLTNVQPAQAGAYTLVVTNVTGAGNESPAMLSVIPPVRTAAGPGSLVAGPTGERLNLENAKHPGPAASLGDARQRDLTHTPNGIFDVLSRCRRSDSIGLGRPTASV